PVGVAAVDHRIVQSAGSDAAGVAGADAGEVGAQLRQEPGAQQIRRGGGLGLRQGEGGHGRRLGAQGQQGAQCGEQERKLHAASLARSYTITYAAGTMNTVRTTETSKPPMMARARGA